MPAIARAKAEWQKISNECYVWGTWGILEDAPGCWYLYPRPSEESYGPFPTPDAAMEQAEEVRGD